MLDLRQIVEEKVILKEKAVNMLEKNNQCFVVGRLSGKFEFHHKGKNCKYYSTTIKIARKNGRIDEIPIIVSKRNAQLDVTKDYTDIKILAIGRYDSICREGKLKSGIFARYVELVGDSVEDENIIYLEGNICKKPNYRLTPKKHQITDLLIATNSENGRRSSYIPCLAWKDIAVRAAKYEASDRIRILGRIESREYTKQNPENKDKPIKKVSYEVSVFKLDRLEK